MDTTQRIAKQMQEINRRLLPWQIFGAIISLSAVLLIAWSAFELGPDPAAWAQFVAVLALIAALFHLLPRAIQTRRSEGQISIRRGQLHGEQIGLYTESEILDIFEKAVSRAGGKVRNPELRVTREKAPEAHTLLNLLWPQWGAKRYVFVSEGALYYLNAIELEAVFLHEIAHHFPCRRLMPGGWLVTDLALTCALFPIIRMGGALYEVSVIFLLVRGLIDRITWPATARPRRLIEHACDLYAARHVGVVPVVNVMLKLGEEAELGEALLALAAKRLIHVKHVDMLDLACAFEQVRPTGRIFHDNLFRHCSAMLTWLGNNGFDLSAHTGNIGRNEELVEYVRLHKAHRKQRMRWRSFDTDGNGELSHDEFRKLMNEVQKHPEYTLAGCAIDATSETHPSFMERVKLLADMMPAEAEDGRK